MTMNETKAIVEQINVSVSIDITEPRSGTSLKHNRVGGMKGGSARISTGH
jgi:hypothetical protein